MSFLRYYHTIKFLKPQQIARRIINKFHSPKIATKVSVSLREFDNKNWTLSCLKPKSYFSNNRFKFLNEEGRIKFNDIWKSNDKCRLWNYNLHYFDYINSKEYRENFKSSTTLLDMWCQNNPLFSEPGWEPYPMSLRIINWIKYHFEAVRLNNRLLKSLYLQSRYLRFNCEFHLGGNHLFENFKALLFAGLFFQGDETENWFTFAAQNLETQMEEQVLEDGGHFERSPMYHAIITEGILDILNILKTYEKDSIPLYSAAKLKLKAMLPFLNILTMPDGEITLLGDSAFNIATKTCLINFYAERIESNIKQTLENHSYYLPKSGYFRFANNNLTVIGNVGSIAPAHLPAHNHADTFTFEMSIDDKRFITDTGVSTYEANSDRNIERGTSAHNTVLIADKNSSDVWQSFRIGQRAEVINCDVDLEKMIAIATHNGYQNTLGFECLHRRTWQVFDYGLKISDRITSPKAHPLKINFHFHPDVDISLSDDPGKAICIFNDKEIKVMFDKNLQPEINETYYSPEFGIKQMRKKLELAGKTKSDSSLFSTEFIIS